jgi:hypothetical protein
MSFFTLLAAIAKKQMTTSTPPPRTKAPLRLSQGSAVEISVVPLVLAEHAGALFDHDLADRHTIIAVGRYALFGINFVRAYLSQNDGAYLHFATKGDAIVETRLYRPYSEQIPTTVDEWSFWLAEEDGYIGYPIMQSKDEDGPKQYQRSWSASDAHIDPALVTELIVDLPGATTAVHHQMMHYSRALNDTLAEHLLVSAVQTGDGMSVNMWLGIDITPQDLTVYPALDAPL